MTDPNDPLDELASAHLDGLTTAAEAARIDADPDLTARVEAMRAVRAQLRDLRPPVDEGRREAAIAAALAAFDDPELAEVTPLRRRHATRLRVIGAVAAVALLALLIPTVTRLGEQGPDDDLASEIQEDHGDSGAGAERDSTFGAMESAPENDASDQATALEAPYASTTTAGAMAALVTLGTFADEASLLTAVREALIAPPGDPAPAPPSPAAARCQAAAGRAAEGIGSAVVLTAVAVLAERQVLVTVTQDLAETRTARVVDTEAGCTPVSTTVL
jgi:hypothetical protein